MFTFEKCVVCCIGLCRISFQIWRKTKAIGQQRTHWNTIAVSYSVPTEEAKPTAAHSNNRVDWHGTSFHWG